MVAAGFPAAQQRPLVCQDKIATFRGRWLGFFLEARFEKVCLSLHFYPPGSGKESGSLGW